MAESGFGSESYQNVTKTLWRTLRLSGSPDRLYTDTFGSPLTFFDGDFTICAWILQTSLSAGVVFDASDGSAEYIRLSVTGSGEVEFEQVDGTGTHTLTTGSVITANQWAFIAARRTGSDLEIIHDDTIYATSLTLSDDAATDRIGVGAETFSPTTYFTGEISRLALFSSAVSDSDLSDMAASRFSTWADDSDHEWFTSEFLLQYGDTTTALRADQGAVSLAAQWYLSNQVSLTEANWYNSYVRASTNYLFTTNGGDWGFGSVLPATPEDHPGDTGFGSPYALVVADTVQVLAPLGTFGDDGGYIAQVLADWPIEGPYRFRLKDSGGTYYPELTYAYSGVPGQSYRCYSFGAGVDIIRFATPPTPTGTFDLRIEWGDNYGYAVEVEDAVVVVNRGRGQEMYAIRQSFSDIRKVGPRVTRSEEML